LAAAEVEASRRGTRRIDPYVAEWFEAGEIPNIRGLTRELGSLGLLGTHLQGYGCAGMSATDYGLACLELEASDSGVRSLVSVQGSLVGVRIPPGALCPVSGHRKPSNPQVRGFLRVWGWPVGWYPLLGSRVSSTTLRSAFTSHHRTSVSGRGLLTWNRVIGKYECKHACNCEGEATRDPFR